MRKSIIVSVAYGGLALALGVFFREFTRGMNYTGATSLSVMHTHAFVLGFLFFLVLALLKNHMKLDEEKKLYKVFFITYNVGLGYLLSTFLVKGILQVMTVDFNASMIAGISGVGHVILGAAFILFFILLIRGAKKTAKDV